MSGGRSPWIRRIEAVITIAAAGLVVAFLLTRPTPKAQSHDSSHVTADANSAAGSSPTGNSGSDASSGSSSSGSSSSGLGLSFDWRVAHLLRIAIERCQGLGRRAGGGSSGSGGGGGSNAKFLQQLEQKATVATHTVYKATYQAKGSTATIVFAQDGAQTSFTSGTTAYYSSGSANTVCDSSSGAPSCYTGAKPLAGLLSLISPTDVSSAIDAAAIASTSLNHSTERHSGQPSSCISYTQGTERVKYCLNDQGIVTYIKIPTGTFQLTTYTTSVSGADVSVPANAKFQPAPSVS